MADPIDYFVDPATGGAAGPGAADTPFDTVQNAMDTIARSAANGDQINVVEGTDDTPAAVLSFAAYGVPAVDAPLIIRGCANDPITGLPVANNGGRGGMDGGAGGFSIIDNSAAGIDFTHLIDMHCHNTGADDVVRLRNSSSVIRCEIDTTTAGWGLTLGGFCTLLETHIHTMTLDAVDIGNYGKILGNMLEVESAARSALFLSGFGSCAMRNIILVNHLTARGIVPSNDYLAVSGNSILSTASGTAAGILVDAAGHDSLVIDSNLIEGFSGAGGLGIDFGASTTHPHCYANNSFFDNETDEGNRGDLANFEEDNEALTATPFLKEGAITFANRLEYFKPTRVGNVKGGAFPNGSRFDRGAINGPAVVERVIPARVISNTPARTVFDVVDD